MTALEDPLNVEWRFQEWLAGMGGLNPDNVLDYFALSPFWDPECNNAVLKMQTQFNNLGEMKQRLSEMTGIEFALTYERYPVLFIIQKQRRRSPTEARPITTYYVLQGNVYQAPDLQSILSNRILTSLHYVEGAFENARNHIEFQPSDGYHWRTEARPLNDPEVTTTASAASVQSLAVATATATPVAESSEYKLAVDCAIRNMDLRAQNLFMQQNQAQAAATVMNTSGTSVGSAVGSGSNNLGRPPGNAADAGSTGASNSAGVSGTPSAPSKSGSATGAGTGTKAGGQKATPKRRKKSEEASLAASNAAATAGGSTASSTNPRVGGGNSGSANSNGRTVGGAFTSTTATGAAAAFAAANGQSGAPAAPKRRKKTKVTDK